MTAIKQLQRDLSELDKHPLVGANAHPINDDLMKWAGIVVGSEDSPFAGIPIRFIMEFPSDYPNTPPKAFFDTFIAYHGGASYYVNNRLAVCLNIFGNFAHVHDEWKTKQEGWSPSYTVSTILVTMQGLMMSFTQSGGNWHSDLLSTNQADINRTIKEATEFKCPLTGHVGSEPAKWFPRVIMNQDELVEKMAALGITNQQSAPDPLRDFYLCYVNKKNVRDGAILGYGIHLENANNGALASPCEYLSLEAFGEGIRRSSTNKPFENWLPILVNEAQWTSVKPLFVESVMKIALSIGFKQSVPAQILKVCSSVMNQLVVEVMNNKNNLTANDKFINGYFSLYRLMARYNSEDPALSTCADAQLHSFLSGQRSKKFVANLGELLIFLTVSKKFTWKDLAQPFQEECDARNFMWYAIGNRNNAPKCPELRNRIKEGRCQKVYDATVVSRSLVAFQIKFSTLASGLGLELLDSNFGLAPANICDELKNAYRAITNLSNWSEYFTYLGMPSVSESERTEQLMRAMDISKAQGYHK